MSTISCVVTDGDGSTDGTANDTTTQGTSGDGDAGEGTGDGGAGDGDGDTMDGGDGDAGAPSWGEAYSALLAAGGCNNGYCHGSEKGGLTLTEDPTAAYAELVGVAAEGPACVTTELARVAPGAPDNSLLIQKLEGTATCGAPMPDGGEPVPQAVIDGLRAWIEAGAPEN